MTLIEKYYRYCCPQEKNVKLKYGLNIKAIRDKIIVYYNYDIKGKRDTKSRILHRIWYRNKINYSFRIRI